MYYTFFQEIPMSTHHNTVQYSEFRLPEKGENYDPATDSLVVFSFPPEGAHPLGRSFQPCEAIEIFTCNVTLAHVGVKLRGVSELVRLLIDRGILLTRGNVSVADLLVLGITVLTPERISIIANIRSLLRRLREVKVDVRVPGLVSKVD